MIGIDGQTGNTRGLVARYMKARHPSHTQMRVQEWTKRKQAKKDDQYPKAGSRTDGRAIHLLILS